MDVTFHELNRPHLQALVPQKGRLVEAVLAQAQRNQTRLNMLLMLSLDEAGCLLTTGADGAELRRALRTAAQCVAAAFALAQTPAGQDVEVVLGTQAVRYRRDQPLPAHNEHRWLTGFFLATAVRDRRIQDLLCAVPAERIHDPRGHAPAYMLPFVETLRALHLGSGAAAAQCADAQQQISQPTGDGEERRMAALLDGPTIELCRRIVHSDYNGFQATLIQALQFHGMYWSHDAESRNAPMGALALGPLAMACLAHDHGVDITVRSDYLPQRLIVGGSDSE